MSIALTITGDTGASPISLSGTSPVLGCTYFPKTPQKNNGEYQDVTESVEVNLQGTADAIRTTVNNIELMLDRAAQRQATGVGAPVYANYDPVGGTTYRSEILEGKVEWTSEPGLRRLWDGTTPPARIAVIWTRRPFWEGAETEASISANAQAAATGGRTIYNNPAGLNWVEAAAAQVQGFLPAPAKITLTNTAGGARVFLKLFLSVNAFSDPSNLVYYLQAENDIDGTAENSAGTSSGGKNISFTPSLQTFKWTLPAADLQRTRGRKARILARFEDITGAEFYVTPAIRDSAGTAVFWTGDELQHSHAGYSCIRDLGIVPLPPGGYSTPSAALTLALTLRGTATAELDVLQLTMLDSYRYLELAQTSVANNAAIILDGIEGLTYVLASGVRTPLAASYGGPLMLQPGVENRIHILNELTTGAGIGDTISVQAWYRPRRVTV